MKKTDLDKAIDRAIEIKFKAVDIMVKDVIEPLEKIGSPEDLIGKPYENWTAQDLQMLIGIYGQKEPNPLSDLVFRKSYNKVKQLEAEEEQR